MIVPLQKRKSNKSELQKLQEAEITDCFILVESWKLGAEWDKSKNRSDLQMVQYVCIR